MFDSSLLQMGFGKEESIEFLFILIKCTKNDKRGTSTFDHMNIQFHIFENFAE